MGGGHVLEVEMFIWAGSNANHYSSFGLFIICGKNKWCLCSIDKPTTNVDRIKIIIGNKIYALDKYCKKILIYNILKINMSAIR